MREEIILRASAKAVSIGFEAAQFYKLFTTLRQLWMVNTASINKRRSVYREGSFRHCLQSMSQSIMKLRDRHDMV